MNHCVTSPSTPCFIKWLITIAIVLSGLYFFEVAKRPLASPDEGRYSELPREMVVSGDYLTPRLNTVKYFEKPPLFYWLQAVSIKLLGPHDFAARLINVLMAVLGSLITLWAGWFLFSPRCGIVSCAIVSSGLLYYGISRIVILDMTVSVFITGAIATMLYALTKGSKKALYAAYIFCALGTLTKGIIGFGIPGAVILLWIITSRQWHLIGRSLNTLGLLIFLAIVAPWHIMVSLKNPEFAWFYFINEHILRLTTQVHQRYQPIWFFIPVFIGGLFPWIPFFFQSVYTAWKERSQLLTQALLLWTGLALVLFSLSQSKLIPYILPSMPPAALLVGTLVDRVWDKPMNSFKHAFLVNLFICFILAAAVYVIPLPAHATELISSTHRGILALIICLVGLVPFLLSSKLSHSFVALATCGMACLLTLNHFSDVIARPSTRDLALPLKTHVTDKTPVICFEFYPQELPFYLERPVMISGWMGELAFGASVEDKSQLIFHHEHTKKLWDQAQQAFIFVRDDTFEVVKTLLKISFPHAIKHHNLILISKRPLV